MQRRLVQRLSQTHITIPCTSTTSIPSRHLTSLYSQGNCNNNSYKYNNSAFFSTSQPQKQQQQQQQQQQQRKEKEEERDRVPIADLPGGVLERDAFRTIIPPSAEDIDASTGKPYGRLTPEELDNLREESFKRRMKRGVEYNPFRAIKEPHKMPATRVTGASPQSPPEMAPIPDMGPERNRLMPDATVQPFTPEQRAMAQQRAEQQRILLEQYIEKNKSKIPEKLRKDLMLLLAFEKKIVENLSLTESERFEKMQEMREKREGVKRNLMSTVEKHEKSEQKGIDAAAATATEAAASEDILGEASPEYDFDLPTTGRVSPVQFGPRNEKGVSLLGAIIASVIASIIMFGLAWPGFKEYFFDPMRHYFKDEVKDKNKIV